MTIEKLSAMPYAQAHVEVYPMAAKLYSYDTLVAAIYQDRLYVYGLHSATTRRHIGAFVREYANLTFQDAKRLCERKLCMNIYTGECCDAEASKIKHHDY